MIGTRWSLVLPTFFFALAKSAPDGINIGGDGTGRDKAQAYKMLGDLDDPVSLRLHLYDKDVGVAGMEFHGDLTMSTVNFKDKKWNDMGFCLRTVDLVTVHDFDCLLVRFYYSDADIENPEADGYSETFTGYDIHAPRLDMTHMLPDDLKKDFLDSNIAASAQDKSGSWTVNVAKSSKVCPSVGNCKFNAHFFRNFASQEDDDIKVTKGSNQKYEVYAFASQYEDLDSGDRETTFYHVGPDQNIYLENLTNLPDDSKKQSQNDAALSGLFSGALAGLSALAILTW